MQFLMQLFKVPFEVGLVKPSPRNSLLPQTLVQVTMESQQPPQAHGSQAGSSLGFCSSSLKGTRRERDGESPADASPQLSHVKPARKQVTLCSIWFCFYFIFSAVQKCFHSTQKEVRLLAVE